MKLRKATNAGMMDCKHALQEAEGDFDKAVDIIRKKGLVVASKRADREAKEGFGQNRWKECSYGFLELRNRLRG